MAEKETKICDVNMSNADNGVIVSWNEKTPKSGGGTYDNANYEYCKEVFMEDKMDKAFDRFKELFLEAREHEKKS
ncbi:MAG TPA: hypothetical protein ACFYEK_01345 [Candidatus Wunengus sp. YC60]|uniref:hypothetical protein n=1 Tax=Candidatus Wunengus sp. YC60 TaxID=3367697 RepID=UPI004025BE3D